MEVILLASFSLFVACLLWMTALVTIYGQQVARCVLKLLDTLPEHPADAPHAQMPPSVWHDQTWAPREESLGGSGFTLPRSEPVGQMGRNSAVFFPPEWEMDLGRKPMEREDEDT